MIKQQEDEIRPYFYFEEEGTVKGKLFFERMDHRMKINHTGVEDVARGQGIGKKLIEYAVNYAREHELKIIPSCAFARDVINEEKEYWDVL